MPSSYNNALRLEMIGTGEQAGIWGDTTNNNLGTLLVDAVAGYTSVSITSANQALTVIDGLEDQSRNAMIALTTVTSANFSVYIPPSSKSYIFYNASSYTATIYNSTSAGNTTAAGTGVAIPAGKVMAVWSEGTNVAQQNTHLISPTLASPVMTTPALGTPASGVMTNVTGLPLTTGVTGTLPVANGGTGVTTSTGSGNVVLSTSPTLVTPALGTPASGVMTNVTGLPLTTGVTGTLPVANGGTGVTTSTGSGNNVLSNSPTLVTPALGTPSSATLTNATGLPLSTGVTGTLPVANGGTGVTTSTGSGSNVLSNSPTLVTPALGTPSSGNLANCTFPTLNQNTTGNAATATSPQSGGSFITSSNIGSQSVNYASSAGSASSATTASSATYATSAGSVSGGLVWRQHATSSFTVGYGSWNNTLCPLGSDNYTYIVQIYWDYSGAYPSYFRGSTILAGNTGMSNAQSSSTQITLGGLGSYGEQCYINTQASGGQHYSPPYIYAYWFNKQGFSNLAPSSLTAYCVVYILTT